jgi:hypothetical protein
MTCLPLREATAINRVSVVSASLKIEAQIVNSCPNTLLIIAGNRYNKMLSAWSLELPP